MIDSIMFMIGDIIRYIYFRKEKNNKLSIIYYREYLQLHGKYLSYIITYQLGRTCLLEFTTKSWLCRALSNSSEIMASSNSCISFLINSLLFKRLSKSGCILALGIKIFLIGKPSETHDGDEKIYTYSGFHRTNGLFSYTNDF